MSALPSEADIRAGLQHVCFVPNSDFSGFEATRGYPRNPPRAPSLRDTSDNTRQTLTGYSLLTEKPCRGTLRFVEYGQEDICTVAIRRSARSPMRKTSCKAPTTRLAAKPNRNEQGSRVVRLRFAAVASVGCTEPEVVHRPVSVMEIIGTVRGQKRRSRQ